MEEEDDDLYDPADAFEYQQAPNGNVKTEELEEGEEEDENAEESDEDDINFITDVKAEPRTEPVPQIKRQASSGTQPQAGTPADNRIKTSTPLPGSKQENGSDLKGPLGSDRPGTDFPGRHTSTIDPNANPIHPATGKPIFSTDLDEDFPSESSKPWRKPGSDITDYFNYGFDEFTWASYCLKQQQIRKDITETKNQFEGWKTAMDSFPGMPPAPGAAGAPAGMPSMTGMPSDAEMQQFMGAMMSQGLDPSAMATMDQNQFMQMMMNGGGPGGAALGGQGAGFGGPPGGQQQQGAYGGGGGGFNQHGGGGGAGGFRGRGGRGRY